MRRRAAWLLVLLAQSGCFRATVHSGQSAGECPPGYDGKWHHGYLAGSIEGSGPHRLDRACAAGWAEVHSETDPLQVPLYIFTGTIYAPQTVEVVCAEPGSPAAPPLRGQGVPPLPSGSAATFPPSPADVAAPHPSARTALCSAAMESLRVEVAEVSRIVLCRPDKHNAMTPEMGQAVAQAVSRINAAPEPRVVLIEGEGRAFCAGGDFSLIEASSRKTPEQNRADLQAFYGSFLTLLRLRVPSIAVVHGAAVGAGLCLALACDVRLAAREAKLGANFVRVGLHPAWAVRCSCLGWSGREGE